MADSFPPPPPDGSQGPADPAGEATDAVPTTAVLPPPAASPPTPPPTPPPAGGAVEPAAGGSSGGGWNKTPFIVVGAILAVVVVVGVIVALVSDASTTDESYSLDAALDNAAEASSVEYVLTLVVGEETVVEVAGAVDGDVVRLELDLGDLLGADPVGSTVEVIVDTAEGVVYIAADELIPSTPLDILIPDFGWIALDVGELDSGGSDDGLQIEDALFGNPLIIIDAVDADPSEATDLGAETIDGVETRHYQFTADVAASIELPDELTALADQFGFDLQIPEGSLGEVTYDVWVTEDNQVRRVAVAFEVAGERLSLQLDIVSIGEDVDVEVPSGDDVFDVSGLFGS